MCNGAGTCHRFPPRQKDEIEYSIGEIEIMIREESKLGAAHDATVEQEMARVREMLHLSPAQLLPSKIDVYLKHYYPDFYDSYPYKKNT